MLKRIVAVVVVLAVSGASAWYASPAVRAKCRSQWVRLVGWTEEARHADPEGFAEHAERTLGRDLEVMQKTVGDLRGGQDELEDQAAQYEAMAEHARQLAADFRTNYQLASTDGGFPVEVRGAAYTEAQVKSQVSMLLAEAEGYEQSLEELQAVRDDAAAQIENLVVRINTTEAQLAALKMKRPMLRARQLTSEGEQLLAQVDELMTGNAQIIEGNPVRTVQELVAAPTEKPGDPVAPNKVEEYLAVGMDEPAPKDPLGQVSQKKPRRKMAKKSKPMFQQS